MAGPQLVLFVCPHGAGKSRMAAAYFNTIVRPDWSATSAGVTPQATVSAHAARLLAGTPAAPALDTTLPRPIDAVAAADVVIAIDCPTPPTPDAVRWQLRHQEFDAPMRDEIRDLVERLAEDLGASAKPDLP
jgi:arsenate reductase (thioredoxin)